MTRGRSGQVIGGTASSDAQLAELIAGDVGRLVRMAGLPPSEVEWWIANASYRRLEAGAAFCRIGECADDFGILRSGILQAYGLTSDGEKVVTDFIFPGMAVMALDAAVRDVPTEVVIEAVTRAELWIWPHKLRFAAFERHEGWRRVETIYLEQAFIRKHRRYMSLRTETSRERFDRLDAELPPEWVYLPQGLIASYLGITPQYLSRLRSEQRRRGA